MPRCHISGRHLHFDGVREWMYERGYNSIDETSLRLAEAITDGGKGGSLSAPLLLHRSASTFVCHLCHQHPSLLHLFTRTSLCLHAHARWPAALVVVVRAPAAGVARLAVVHVGHVAWWCRLVVVVGWVVFGVEGARLSRCGWSTRWWRCQACPRVYMSAWTGVQSAAEALGSRFFATKVWGMTRQWRHSHSVPPRCMPPLVRPTLCPPRNPRVAPPMRGIARAGTRTSHQDLSGTLSAALAVVTG